MGGETGNLDQGGSVMKTVILAGGHGTRIGEETKIRPKPMVEIGGKPILWHIMKLYSHYGFREFIICCGYKGQMIKEYFVHYYMYQSDSTFYLDSQERQMRKNQAEPWKVTLANTGLDTRTAGRLLKVRDYIGDEPFLLTYGDGVSDVNIPKLIDFHRAQGRIATITTTQPSGRFGALKINSETNQVMGFKEKARADSAWVNAGFMVLDKGVFDYLGDGSEMLEAGPFEAIAEEGQMAAYKHDGFWSPMDTMRDKEYLEGLWSSEQAPWKVW